MVGEAEGLRIGERLPPCRCPHETTFAGKVAAEWGGAGGGRRGLANLQF